MIDNTRDNVKNVDFRRTPTTALDSEKWKHGQVEAALVLELVRFFRTICAGCALTPNAQKKFSITVKMEREQWDG